MFVLNALDSTPMSCVLCWCRRLVIHIIWKLASQLLRTWIAWPECHVALQQLKTWHREHMRTSA